MDLQVRNFVSVLSRSLDSGRAATADNCRFDERASSDRWARFGGCLESTPKQLTWELLLEANKIHCDRYIKVASNMVPDTFVEINRGAWCTSAVAEQPVVRMEFLDFPFSKTGMTFENLESLRRRSATPKGTDAGDARRALGEFFHAWNISRDSRPMFATFSSQLIDEIASDDWPHAVRDRLGLGEPSARRVALPVALMQYSLKEVIEAQVRRQILTPAALPSVLDNGMHQFFFPAPVEHPYGATLHLDPEKSDLLTAELLHPRIDYRPEHLIKLGMVTRDHGMYGDPLRSARDLHLLQLRIESGRDDFGEELVGRS